MNPSSLKKILEHPDKDEIISKLVIGISPKDIAAWIKSKYKDFSSKKFILTESLIKTFQTKYLDVYNIIYEDINSAKQNFNEKSIEQITAAVKNNPTYKSKILELAGKELDIRQIISNLCVAIENRLAQVFDEIQEDPKNINTKVDRLLIDYTEVLGNILEKYYKFTEAPAATTNIQNNITLQVVDKHIAVFHDVIREVLSQMDLETSLYFMEVFNEKMSKLKEPSNNMLSADTRLADAKLLNETINNRLNN